MVAGIYMRKSIVQEQPDNFKIIFNQESAGFPSSMALPSCKGWEEVVQSSHPWLEITLADGAKARPFWPDDFQPVETAVGDARRLDFRNLPWRSANGTILDDFGLSLRYEFWPDGTTFVNTFFVVRKTTPPSLEHFTFTVPMTFPREDKVFWSYWERLQKAEAETLIQALRGIKRYLPAGSNQHIDGMVLPLVCFDFGFNEKLTRHVEWILEGFNSLTDDFRNTATDITWDNNNANLRWEFLKEQRSSIDRPWQWRNQWGWVLGQSPRKRRHAPLRMYHYLDHYKRYPTDRQIAKMSREGADLLVLHEQWRLDPQNSGWPYNTRELTRVIAKAHAHELRVALYIRGEEISAREELCDWFDEFLEKDFDGLYMDYGSPVCHQSVDERFLGGRILFREYYLMMRRLRERVGEKGVILSHSGPFCCACGTAGLVDGYVAGEGERGVMLKDRTVHAYFSSISVAPPTMWTAAFPDYNSEKSVPFLASVAQSPHIPLGIQIVSSSLAHPREPGNVTYIRPLWKLWGLFKGETDVTVLHDFNTEEVFICDSPATAACIMQARDGTFLVIASNFSEQYRHTSVGIDWQKSGLKSPGKNFRVLLLDPKNESPTISPGQSSTYFEHDLHGYGVVGWLIYPENNKWRQRLEQFKGSYPEMDEDEKEYLKDIEYLCSRRFDPKGMNRVHMQVTVPNFPEPYEDSMWWDLYDDWHELFLMDRNNTQRFLGYVSCKGLTREKPAKDDYIWPGHKTPWIALHELLPAGEHDLAIKTCHHGEDFYSFIIVTITGDPETLSDAYEVAFANKLDPDRSLLRFRIRII